MNANEVALYVADQINNKLKVVDLSTLIARTVWSNVDITGQFQLAGVTVYQLSLYAGVPGTVLKFTIDPTTYSLSNYVIFSGTVGTFGYSDGSYATSQYGFVNYITHDGAGNLYIGDHSSGDIGSIDGIRRLSVETGNITTVAGMTGRTFGYHR